MRSIDFLLEGLIIGISIAAPVGPVGLLCIQRTLLRGRIAGFVSGLGAATADAMYGSVAGFGLGVVSGFLVRERIVIHFVGGALLMALGIRGLLRRPAEHAVATRPDQRGLFWSYASMFLLTIANPMTILSFTAIFAGLGVASSINGYIAASTTVLGVFLGSAIWWFALSGLASLSRNRFHPRALRRVNQVSGIVILTFGVYGVWTSGVL